jgi:hypothetical protein
VDVVLNVEPLGRGRVGRLDIAVPDVLTRLDRVGRCVQVTLAVQIEVGDVVSQRVEHRLTHARADGIRGPHVGREESKHRVESDLVPYHLVSKLSLGELTRVLVRPCVARDLVSFGHHALDIASASLRASAFVPTSLSLHESLLPGARCSHVTYLEKRGVYSLGVVDHALP